MVTAMPSLCSGWGVVGGIKGLVPTLLPHLEALAFIALTTKQLGKSHLALITRQLGKSHLDVLIC